MLGVAMLAGVLTTPGQTFCISCFNPSLANDLVLEQSWLTGAYMAGTLLASLCLTAAGSAMDRFGLRRSLVVVAVALGGACFFMAAVRNWAMLLAAFFLLRLLGQGALSLLAANTLSMWFSRRLGMASGLRSLAMAGAVAIVPSGALVLIDKLGWRETYMLFGVIVWVLLVLVWAVWFRNRPEDVGQTLDGLAKAESEAGKPTSGRADFVLSEAMRTPAFWILLVSGVGWSLMATGIFFSMLPLLESHGLNARQVGWFYAPFAISMAVMQAVGGWLTDRYPIYRLLTVSMLGFTTAFGLLTAAYSVAMLVAFAVMLGASQGLLTPINSTVWARYYGRSHLGKIRGAAWTGGVAGSAVGPFVMGLTMDFFGSYDACLYAFVGCFAVITVTAWFARPPRLEPVRA